MNGKAYVALVFLVLILLLIGIDLYLSRSTSAPIPLMQSEQDTTIEFEFEEAPVCEIAPGESATIHCPVTIDLTLKIIGDTDWITTDTIGKAEAEIDFVNNTIEFKKGTVK